MWNKFHQIRQRTGTTIQPIKEVFQDLEMARIRLPVLTKEQIFHQLLEAIEKELRSRVRPLININQKWEKTKDTVCEWDASIYEERLDQQNQRNTYQTPQFETSKSAQAKERFSTKKESQQQTMDTTTKPMVTVKTTNESKYDLEL